MSLNYYFSFAGLCPFRRYAVSISVLAVHSNHENRMILKVSVTDWQQYIYVYACMRFSMNACLVGSETIYVNENSHTDKLVSILNFWRLESK